jgi:hypothetical protein
MDRREFVSGAFLTLSTLGFATRPMAAEGLLAAAIETAKRETPEVVATLPTRRIIASENQPSEADNEAALQALNVRVNAFVTAEFPLRQKVLEAALQSSPQELAGNVDASFKPYAALFAEEGIALVPAPGTVKPLSADPVPAEQGEGLGAVAIDIILQTFDLNDMRDVIVVILTEHTPASQAYAQLIGALTSTTEPVLGKAEKAALAIFALAKILGGEGTRAFLYKRFGPERAKSTFTRIGVGLVAMSIPFLGWARVTGYFAVALFANWDRVQKALGRA